MIVDTHTHLWQSLDQLGPQISALMRQRYPVANERLDASSASHEAATAALDLVFVLGFRSVHLGADVPNALISHYVTARRDRMIGFAGIDPMADDWSDQMDELPSLKLSGVVISPSEQAFHPTHSRAMKLYDKAQSMGLPVIIYQGSQFTRDSHLEFARPALLDEVARSFPQLRMLITHSGHPWAEELLTLIRKHNNLFTELSVLTTRPWQLYQVLLTAHHLEVTDRVMFGSSFPYQMPQQAIETIYSVNQFAQGTALPAVPREKLRSIIERDALSALGLKRGIQSESAPPMPVRPTPSRVTTPSRDESDS
ncbi:amidohydrolase family protein [Planctomycetales bacterium ZRK34]|nr:amidohydrolase family protein [Planctomycetales bacterium ZRK34]